MNGVGDTGIVHSAMESAVSATRNGKEKKTRSNSGCHVDEQVSGEGDQLREGITEMEDHDID